MRLCEGYDCWRLLGILRDNGPADTHQLAAWAGHSKKVVLQSLRHLAKLGKVQKIKSGKRGSISYPATWKAKAK